MSAQVLVVVSGLAASGKTTVGKALSTRLSLPLLDKDTILEALFDGLGCNDRDERQHLSRASDEVLFRLAGELSGTAILVNWWNHDTAPARLKAASEHLVEVFCDCPVEVAAARFAARQRHRGHLDHLRTSDEHEAGIQRMKSVFRGPLGLNERLVTVDTTGVVDHDAVAARVRTAIEDALRDTNPSSPTPPPASSEPADGASAKGTRESGISSADF